MKLFKVFIIGLFLSHASFALEIVPYTAESFAAAQAEGKPNVLFFHASWCPTCRAQLNSLNEIKKEPDLNVTVFQANFDKESELKKQMKIHSQGVLLFFHGSKKVGRIAGDTSVEIIRDEIKNTL